MKTLCIKSSNVSAYAFDDNQQILQNGENTIVGDPVEWIIGDLTIENSVMYVNIKLPSDWKAQKYTFNGGNWALNPAYIDPDKLV